MFIPEFLELVRLNHIPSWDKVIDPIDSSVGGLDQRKVVEKAVAYNRFGNFLRMGSGKTYITCVSIVTAICKAGVEQVLVVAPNKEDWYAGFSNKYITDKNFLSEIFVKIVDTGNKEDLGLFGSKKGIYICTKDTLVSFYKKYSEVVANIFCVKGFRKRFFVYDEVHQIKNPKSKVSQIVSEISQGFFYRHVLTGTQVPNGFEDFYSLLKILDCGIVPKSKSSFTKVVGDTRYIREFNRLEVLSYKKDVVDGVLKLIESFTVSGELDAVKDEWGEVNVNLVDISLDDTESLSLLYRNIVTACAYFLRDRRLIFNMLLYLLSDANMLLSDSFKVSEGKTVRVGFKRILEILNSDKGFFLSLIAGCVCKESKKFLYTLKKVQVLKEKGKRLLIWSKHPSVVKSYSEALSQAGVSTAYVVGAGSLRNGVQKFEVVERFNRDSGVDVLLGTFGSLATSVSVRGVRDAVMVDIPLNFVEYEQSIGRLFGFNRGEYGKGVDVDVLFYGKTIENRCVQILKKKQNIASLVSKRRSWKDFEEFLRGY